MLKPYVLGMFAALVLCACVTSQTLPKQDGEAPTVGRRVAGVGKPPARSAAEHPHDADGKCVGAEALAKCLASKGAKLYGNCYDREFALLARSFGKAIDTIDVTMCMTCMDVYMTNADCIAQKIDDYPTWIFKDGKRLEGRQHFPTIAKAAGCKF